MYVQSRRHRLGPKALNDLQIQRNIDFRHWVTPSNLAHLQARNFFRLRNVGKTALMNLESELRRLGINAFPRRQDPQPQPVRTSWKSRIEALGSIRKEFPPRAQFQLFELDQPATFKCSVREIDVTSTKVALNLRTGDILCNGAYGQLLANHPQGA